jgi:hypothetical protein
LLASEIDVTTRAGAGAAIARTLAAVPSAPGSPSIYDRQLHDHTCTRTRTPTTKTAPATPTRRMWKI